MKTLIKIIAALIIITLNSSFISKTIISGLAGYFIINNYVKAQSYGSGGSVLDTSYAIFETPIATPRYDIIKIKRTGMHVKAKALILDSMTTGNFSIINDKYVWMDQTTGQIKSSKRDTLIKLLNNTLSFLPTSYTASIPAQVNVSGAGSSTISGSYPNITITTPTNLNQFTNGPSYISSYSPTLTTSGYSIGVVNGNTLALPPATVSIGYIPLQTEIDGSITNEIQALSGSGTQTISLSSGGTFIIPTQTVATTITASTGISVGGSHPSYTLTNTLPDQTVALTASTGISTSGTYPNFTITNSIPDKTVTITGNNDITVTSAYPGFSLTPYVLSANSATRATNSATFQISSTRNAWVAYTIRINCVATIGSSSSGTVALQYSINGGSSWIDISQLENSNIVTLAVVLNSNTTQTSILFGFIPLGTIQRIVTTTAGTTTVTYIRGQETY